MIEVTLRQYLGEHLDVPVWLEEPESPPKSYVLIERTGSQDTDCIELPTISAVYINSDYNFTDTETKRYRYQCVAVVTHYER